MIFSFSFFVLKAIAREIGPTLPRYMVAIIINFPHIFNPGVRSLVSPTVAVALTVSYAISRESAFVTADNSNVDTNIIINDIQNTATALLTAFFGIVLWKRTASFLFFIVHNSKVFELF